MSRKVGRPSRAELAERKRLKAKAEDNDRFEKERGYKDIPSLMREAAPWAAVYDGKFKPIERALFEFGSTYLNALAGDTPLTLAERQSVAKVVIDTRRQYSTERLKRMQDRYNIMVVEHAVQYRVERGLTAEQAYAEIAAANDLKPASLTRYLRDAKRRLRNPKY